MKKKLKTFDVTTRDHTVDDLISAAIRNIKEIVVPVSKLMLDRDNPRLRSAEKSRATAIPDLSSKPVQDEAEEVMWAMNHSSTLAMYYTLKNEGIVSTMATLHVCSLPDGNYLLCDGNTRITAARKLLRDHEEGKIALAPDVMERLTNIRVGLLGDYGDTNILWNLIRAKMHLSGQKEWGSFQRAAFVVRLKEANRYTNDQMRRVLGFKQNKAVKDILNAWGMFQIARRDVSYGQSIKEKHFGVFIEVAKGGQPIRNYIGWNGTAIADSKISKFRQLLELMAPKDGGSPFVTSSSQKNIRVLRDDPETWEKAVKFRDPKNKKHLDILLKIEKGRDVNELVEKLIIRLKGISIEEMESLRAGDVRELARRCNSVMMNLEKLAAA